MGKIIAVAGGKRLERISGWLPVHHDDNVSNDDYLYYYAEDGYGFRSTASEFNPSEGVYLDWFAWNRKRYALGQFINFGFSGYAWIEDGERHCVCYYDANTIFNAPLIEYSEDLEYVRMYKEV